FAAPMFCNIGAVEAYNLRLANRIHRFVNNRDVVPLLPVGGIANPYRHVGIEETLSSAGDEGGMASDVAQIIGLAASLAGSSPVTALRTLLWQEVQARVGAHSLSDGYIVPIVAKLKKDATAGPDVTVSAVTSGNG